MRDAVGSTWVFSMVILFTLIFAGFLVLVLDYSRAYKIKNEMTTIVEKYEGFSSGDNGSIKIINNFLINNGYKNVGSCADGEYGVLLSSNDNKAVEAHSGVKYNYCFERVKESKCYFKIRVFYPFELPVLGTIKNITITGQTNSMNYATINLDNKECK